MNYLNTKFGWGPADAESRAHIEQILAVVTDAVAEGRLAFHPKDFYASHKLQVGSSSSSSNSSGKPHHLIDLVLIPCLHMRVQERQPHVLQPYCCVAVRLTVAPCLRLQVEESKPYVKQYGEQRLPKYMQVGVTH
jgi:hypothetical protein